LQYVAVCCSVLQCVAVCCSVLQCVAVCCSVLQRAAVYCSVIQCVAVCGSGHVVASSCRLSKLVGFFRKKPYKIGLFCKRNPGKTRAVPGQRYSYSIAVCCSVLQCVAVCCNVLLHVAVCCSCYSMLQCDQYQ